MNGHTIAPGDVAAIPAPVPTPFTEAADAVTTPAANSRTRLPRPVSADDAQDVDSDESKSSSGDAGLPSPSIRRIISSISPTLDSGDADDVRSTRSRSRSRTTSEVTSSTKTKASASSLPDKPSKKPEEEDRPSATMWIALAGGIVGGLLLIMAISAYYRRWRRKRKENFENGSFVSKAADMPDSPRTIARSSMASEKTTYVPDWSDAPLVPPIPVPYRDTSNHSSFLPAPGSEPGPEALAPWRNEGYAVGGSEQASLVVPRQRGVTEPTSIEVSGDQRLFSRPVSEVILNGQNEQIGELAYDYCQPYDVHHVRHNSYASSRYEAIEDARTNARGYNYI